MPRSTKSPKSQPAQDSGVASTPKKTRQKQTPAPPAKPAKKKTLPAKTKPTTTTTTKPPRNPSGRAVKHDWSAIRREYIRGDDDVTYKVLSAREGAPHETTIEKRAASENWAALRLDFRREVDLKIRQVDVDLKTEVRRRHAGIGKGMTEIGERSLKAIGEKLIAQQDSSRKLLEQAAKLIAEGAPVNSTEVQTLMDRAADARNLASLDTMDIVRFIKYGTDLERKALGMEELNVNFRNIQNPEDLDRLTEDQLWKLMGQLPPEEDDEGW